MIESGFYYTGCGDCVTCFHCGITLRNWEHADNVDMEHKNILLRINIFLCVIKFKQIGKKTMVEEKSIGQIYSECCDWMLL